MSRAVHVVVTGSREWPEEQLEALFAEGFPPFITADHEVKKHIGGVRERFGHLDVVLLDGEEPVATGWGVPIAWGGEPTELPETFAEVLRCSLVDAEPDTFVICGGVVHPERKGTGTAGDLLRALVDLGRGQGLERVVAPVRPTRKHHYPLTPIEQYAAWVRADGEALDPWLRLHLRLGGQVVALAPRAQTMTGTAAQWEAWTGLPLPTSGEYVVPAGLGVLRLDREADLGTYVEPNIWVRHA